MIIKTGSARRVFKSTCGRDVTLTGTLLNFLGAGEEEIKGENLFLPIHKCRWPGCGHQGDILDFINHIDIGKLPAWLNKKSPNPNQLYIRASDKNGALFCYRHFPVTPIPMPVKGQQLFFRVTCLRTEQRRSKNGGQQLFYDKKKKNWKSIGWFGTRLMNAREAREKGIFKVRFQPYPDRGCDEEGVPYGNKNKSILCVCGAHPEGHVCDCGT